MAPLRSTDARGCGYSGQGKWRTAGDGGRSGFREVGNRWSASEVIRRLGGGGGLAERDNMKQGSNGLVPHKRKTENTTEHTRNIAVYTRHTYV